MLLASKSNSKLFYFNAVLYISSIDSTVVREVISYSFDQCLHEFLNIYVFGYNVAEARCKRFPINIIISLGRYLLNKYTFVKYTFFSLNTCKVAGKRIRRVSMVTGESISQEIYRDWFCWNALRVGI